MHPENSKIPDYQTSIFTKMSRLSNEFKAINLSQGFPDFQPDPKLIALVQEAYSDSFHQYAPMEGVLALREAISDKVYGLHQTHYHPESEITISCGATQAIFTALAAMVFPGDEVIVLKPAYDCYEPGILAQKGIPVPVQLKGEDYAPDWEAIAAAITPKTKMIILNNPHNPSGRVWTDEDFDKLASILSDTSIYILSDEVYEHLVFDEKLHRSIASVKVLKERSFICCSFGKTFHVTGWKIGYCLAPAPLMLEFRKIHEFNVFSNNHPVQQTLAKYLQTDETYLALNAFFQKKRDLFLGALKNSRFNFTPAEGTYFQILNYRTITEDSDVLFAERLTREIGVASIPVSVFNTNREDYKQLRFCFAKKDSTLLKAAEKLSLL